MAAVTAPDDPRHGTNTGYVSGRCRCDACRTAHTNHSKRSPSHRAAQQAANAAPGYLKANYPEEWKQLLADAYRDLGLTQRRVGRP